MGNKDISLVITDLDNTLYDWFEVWYQSFNAMLSEIENISGYNRDCLIPQIKIIHEKYNTAEYSFLIQELPLLKNLHPNVDLFDKYDKAIHAYRHARKSSLSLYPTVYETLKKLNGFGCKIVVYTESQDFYSCYRVKKLGLDGIIDVVYSPESHDIPEGLNLEQVRRYSPSHYSFKNTIMKHTPKGEIKPNPKVLRDIIADMRGAEEKTIYIGDSLVKDVYMAQKASICDVYASYGTSHRREGYELLKSVTHWTDEMVEKEKSTSDIEVVPTVVLKNLFSELLDNFNFIKF